MMKTSMLGLSLVLAVLIWSAMAPSDRFTWWLEVFPVLIGLPLLMLTYKRFRLTGLLYGLLTLHMVILLVGGHYTYAKVPLFDWLKEPMGWERNHFDRLGHFAQGLIPAMVSREILLRRSPLKPGKWLSFIVICIALAISAVYELIEWAVAIMTGAASDAFLGTQGDPWDTQSDMAMALLGATLGVISLSRWQDRQLTWLYPKA